MTTCRRTEAILERQLDNLPLSSADAAHLRTCGTCGPASARLPAFGGALRFATRAIAGEPIPSATLSADVFVADRATPSRRLFAAAALAVVVAAGLTILVLGPRLGPDVGVLPPVRPILAEREIVAQLASAGFACSELDVEPTATPVIRGMMCHPTGSAALRLAAIVVERNADGDVREVIAKASPDNPKDPNEARAVVDILAAAVRAGVANPVTRAELETWVRDNAGRLSPGESGLRMFGPLIVGLDRFVDDGLGLHITVAPTP